MTKEVERFTLRLPKGLKSQLEACSKQMGVSLNALVIQLLWEKVEGKKNPPNLTIEKVDITQKGVTS